MMRSMAAAGLAIGLALIVPAVPAGADTERVAFPDGFMTEFVRFAVVDRLDRNTARFMYMSRPAWEAARAGESLPDETVLIMEDHLVRMKGEAPVLDAAGRLIPTDATKNVFVMEKRAGWGADVAEELRNGDWEYAWFSPEGVRSEKPVAPCFECHKGQAAEDFTFTAFPAVAADK